MARESKYRVEPIYENYDDSQLAEYARLQEKYLRNLMTSYRKVEKNEKNLGLKAYAATAIEAYNEQVGTVPFKVIKNMDRSELIGRIKHTNYFVNTYGTPKSNEAKEVASNAIYIAKIKKVSKIIKEGKKITKKEVNNTSLNAKSDFNIVKKAVGTVLSKSYSSFYGDMTTNALYDAKIISIENDGALNNKESDFYAMAWLISKGYNAPGNDSKANIERAMKESGWNALEAIAILEGYIDENGREVEGLDPTILQENEDRSLSWEERQSKAAKFRVY